MGEIIGDYRQGQSKGKSVVQEVRHQEARTTWRASNPIFTDPPIHQAAHYKPSAPYVHNHYHGTPNNNFPTQAPANTKAGYPPAPYPGVSKEIETKVDPEMEKGDSSDQDTDIKMEMARLR